MAIIDRRIAGRTRQYRKFIGLNVDEDTLELLTMYSLSQEESFSLTLRGLLKDWCILNKDKTNRRVFERAFITRMEKHWGCRLILTDSVVKDMAYQTFLDTIQLELEGLEIKKDSINYIIKELSK